jgi:hypothetical protein
VSVAGKYIDFDAALSEADEQPVVVRYLGRDWELFSSLPAKPVMKLLRLRAEGRGEDELEQPEMVAFMTEMVPEAVLEAWLDGGLTISQMAQLLRAIVGAYRGVGDEAEDEPGEAPGPEAGPLPSSSTGPR